MTSIVIPFLCRANSSILTVLKEFGIGASATSDHGISAEPFTPMELAQCYTLMARLGNAPLLSPGIRVAGGPGKGDARSRRVSVSPAVIFLVNHLMKQVDSVTVNGLGQDRSAAYYSILSVRDKAGLWSIVYRADALLLIRTAGHGAMETAIRKMTASLMPGPEMTPGLRAKAPDGIVFRKICVESGLRSTSVCPKVIREPFLKGSQPVEWCPYRHDSHTVPAKAGDAKQGLQKATR